MALGDVYAEVTAVGIQGLSGGGGTGNGATGSTGPVGNDGATGPIGASGATGVGTAGATGSTGPQGIQGASGVGTGSHGATGVQGASGATGSGFSNQGPWSSGATYNAGDYVTYNSVVYVWSSPSSGNTVGAPNTDPASWFSITGPQGATGVGASGVAGASGYIGRDGATGSQGIQGASGVGGASGYVGSDGATGATGLTGATGAGLTGATGIQGASGATGTQGASGIGFTGATGEVGPTGPAGASGVGGASGYVGRDGATGIRGASGSTGLTGATGNLGPVGASGAGVIQETVFTTDGTTDEQLLEVIDTATVRSSKFEMQVTRGSDVQVSELRLLHDAANVFLNEYGVLGPDFGTFATYFSPLVNNYSSPSINTGGVSYWNGSNLRVYTTSNTVIQALQSIIIGLEVRLNSSAYTVQTTSKFTEVSTGIWQATVTPTRSPILLLSNIAWDGTGTCELRFTPSGGITTLKYIRTDLSV
jgi:hypothetical protein